MTKFTKIIAGIFVFVLLATAIFADTLIRGATTSMHVVPGEESMKTGSLANGLILDIPMVSGWMQSSTALSDRAYHHSHATVTGNPVVSATKTTFDGVGDRYTVSDSTNQYFNFDGTTDFTISLIVSGSFSSRTIFVDHRTTTGFVLQSGTLGKTMDFFLNDGANRNCTFNNADINDGSEHMLTFVYDADDSPTRNAFFDGVEVSTVSCAATVGDFSHALDVTIGGNGAGSNLLVGTARNLKIWNRALTPAEVQLLYDKEI